MAPRAVGQARPDVLKDAKIDGPYPASRQQRWQDATVEREHPSERGLRCGRGRLGRASTHLCLHLERVECVANEHSGCSGHHTGSEADPSRWRWQVGRRAGSLPGCVGWCRLALHMYIFSAGKRALGLVAAGKSAGTHTCT